MTGNNNEFYDQRIISKTKAVGEDEDSIVFLPTLPQGEKHKILYGPNNQGWCLFFQRIPTFLLGKEGEIGSLCWGKVKDNNEMDNVVCIGIQQGQGERWGLRMKSKPNGQKHVEFRCMLQYNWNKEQWLAYSWNKEQTINIKKNNVIFSKIIPGDFKYTLLEVVDGYKLCICAYKTNNFWETAPNRKILINFNQEWMDTTTNELSKFAHIKMSPYFTDIDYDISNTISNTNSENLKDNLMILGVEKGLVDLSTEEEAEIRTRLRENRVIRPIETNYEIQNSSHVLPEYVKLSYGKKNFGDWCKVHGYNYLNNKIHFKLHRGTLNGTSFNDDTQDEINGLLDTEPTCGGEQQWSDLLDYGLDSVYKLTQEDFFTAVHESPEILKFMLPTMQRIDSSLDNYNGDNFVIDILPCQINWSSTGKPIWLHTQNDSPINSDNKWDSLDSIDDNQKPLYWSSIECLDEKVSSRQYFRNYLNDNSFFGSIENCDSSDSSNPCDFFIDSAKAGSNAREKDYNLWLNFYDMDREKIKWIDCRNAPVDMHMEILTGYEPWNSELTGINGYASWLRLEPGKVYFRKNDFVKDAASDDECISIEQHPYLVDSAAKIYHRTRDSNPQRHFIWAMRFTGNVYSKHGYWSIGNTPRGPVMSSQINIGDIEDQTSMSDGNILYKTFGEEWHNGMVGGVYLTSKLGQFSVYDRKNDTFNDKIDVDFDEDKLITGPPPSSFAHAINMIFQDTIQDNGNWSESDHIQSISFEDESTAQKALFCELDENLFDTSWCNDYRLDTMSKTEWQAAARDFCFRKNNSRYVNIMDENCLGLVETSEISKTSYDTNMQNHCESIQNKDVNTNPECGCYSGFETQGDIDFMEMTATNDANPSVPIQCLESCTNATYKKNTLAECNLTICTQTQDFDMSGHYRDIKIEDNLQILNCGDPGATDAVAAAAAAAAAADAYDPDDPAADDPATDVPAAGGNTQLKLEWILLIVAAVVIFFTACGFGGYFLLKGR